MKKIFTVFLIVCFLALQFSGCRAIQNITDPIPDEYTEGISLPDNYPEQLKVHTYSVVFESYESKDKITIRFGTNHTLSGVAKFYNELFDSDDFVIDTKTDEYNKYFVQGSMEGYTFEIDAHRPKEGSYEERAYNWITEISVQPVEILIDNPVTPTPSETPAVTPTPEEEIIHTDPLETIAGFWQLCGGLNSIDVYYNSHGAAFEIKEDMTLTGYYDFEMVYDNIPFTFVAEDIISFEYDGQVQEVSFHFETIYDEEYLTAYGENYIKGELVFSGYPELNFEKSSYETMMSYQGLREVYEREITLDEPLTDDELMFLIVGCDWIISHYYYPDGTTERAVDNVSHMYRFEEDYTGFYQDHRGNLSTFSWDFNYNSIFISHDDGSKSAYLLDYSNDSSYDNTCLYFFNMELSRTELALVFIRFAC